MTKDTAKSTQIAGRSIAAIDLNRAGTGLMEIVSEPDMRSVGVMCLRGPLLTTCSVHPKKLLIM